MAINVKDLGISVPQAEQKVKEPSKAIYNRKVLDDVPAHMKSVYSEAVGCDIYSAGGVMGFKTSSKGGIAFAGYNTVQEAFEVVQKMAKLEVYGNWNIVQHLENKKFFVVPALNYKK